MPALRNLLEEISPRRILYGKAGIYILVWTLFIGLLVWAGYFMAEKEAREIAVYRAKDAYQKDLLYRRWASERGGVYVPRDEKTPTNPYLKDLPNREITTKEGRVFTLVNPAYMTRMVHELGAKDYGLKGHITSLEPLRPENAADPWETSVLKKFNAGAREVWEDQTIEGRPHIRFMGAFLVEEGCLRCHGHQGYRVGDVRGGISISVPLTPGGAMFLGTPKGRFFLLGLAVVWGVGCVMIILFSKEKFDHARDQERVLEELRSRESLLRTYFDSAPDGIFVTDGAGRYLQANPAALAMTGYTLEELRRLNVRDLGAPNRQDGRPSLFETLQYRNDFLAEIALQRKNGEIFPVTLRAAKISDDLVIGLCRDITEQKRQEEERRRLEIEVQHAQQLEGLGSLAGGVAHDMNNVLTAIMGLGSVLQAKLVDDPVMAKSINTILLAAGRGRDMVKGLTEFARKGIQEPQLLDLTVLVQREADLLQRTTLQKYEIQLELDSALPKVMGEPTSLSNAIMNLCVNAMDAMPKGGRLRMATSHDNGFVALLVEDNGEGMTPEVRQRAMEPFFTTKPVGKGTGLGLAMVYGAVKAHGGSLEIESEPGKGTRIWLRIPESSEELPISVASRSTVERDADRRLSVLLVDDDPLIRDTMPFLMESLGHKVVTASGGLEALRQLEAGLEVDLAVLDMNMPGMNGIETLARLRLLRSEMPVIIATGFLDTEIGEQLAADHRVSTLLKPYELQDLARKINQVAGLT